MNMARTVTITKLWQVWTITDAEVRVVRKIVDVCVGDMRVCMYEWFVTPSFIPRVYWPVTSMRTFYVSWTLWMFHGILWLTLEGCELAALVSLRQPRGQEQVSEDEK